MSLTTLETFAKLRPPDCVRIKVKKQLSINNLQQHVHETKKFCVDPQITSYDILKCLVIKAFSIKGDFDLSYLNRDKSTSIKGASNTHANSKYLLIQNDWDLDAAFMNSSEPFLYLIVDIKHDDDEFDDWDVISAIDIPLLNANQNGSITNNFNIMNVDDDGRSLIATWNNAADKAMSIFQKFFHSLSMTSSSQPSSSSTLRSMTTSITSHEDDDYCLFGQEYAQIKWKKPLTYEELQNFLDSDGRIVQPQELRQRIYEGGCDSTLRPFIWRYLLNIFPLNYTSQERTDYLHQLTQQYNQLKSYWYKKEHIIEDPLVKTIATKIQKDVSRTDRLQSFYSGHSNTNIQSLFNILLTFSLTHSSISYSQGMSDLLSPLLYVLKDEAQAYVCFCVCMKRLQRNFSIFSDTIETNIRMLSLLLKEYSPKLWSHFENVGCEQLVFVYRWLLLECKREFPFDDMLRMLEIMWSTLKFDCVDEKSLDTLDEKLYLYEIDSLVQERPTPISPPQRRSRKNSKNNESHGSATVQKCRKTLKYQQKQSRFKVVPVARDDTTDECEYETDDSEEDETEEEEKEGDVKDDSENEHQQTVYSKDDFFKRQTLDIRSIFERSLKLNDDQSRKQSCSTTCSCSNNSQFNTSFSSYDGTQAIEDIYQNDIPDTPVNTDEDETSHSFISCVMPKTSTISTSTTNTNTLTNTNQMDTISKPTIDSGYVSDVTNSPFFMNCNQEDLLYLLQTKTDNPFLLFLCLTLFIEQSDFILNSQMDSNDIACYFDKLCRKHNSKQILNKARYLYSKLYLSKLNVFNYLQQLMHIQNSP